MSLATPAVFLRRVLAADAAISAASGLAMALGAGLASRWLGLPAPLLQFAGASCLPFALGVAWLALRPRPPRAGVCTVIVINALWALECLALAAGAGVEPSAFGIGFLLLQAIVVAGLAELEFMGLRRLAQPRSLAAA